MPVGGDTKLLPDPWRRRRLKLTKQICAQRLSRASGPRVGPCGKRSSSSSQASAIVVRCRRGFNSLCHVSPRCDSHVYCSSPPSPPSPPVSVHVEHFLLLNSIIQTHLDVQRRRPNVWRHGAAAALTCLSTRRSPAPQTGSLLHSSKCISTASICFYRSVRPCLFLPLLAVVSVPS